MRFVYFASVREAIGLDGEEDELPDSITTIADVLDWLDQRHTDIFKDRSRLRFALDQNMANVNAPLAGAKELAIFPPVTGG